MFTLVSLHCFYMYDVILSSMGVLFVYKFKENCNTVFTLSIFPKLYILARKKRNVL